MYLIKEFPGTTRPDGVTNCFACLSCFNKHWRAFKGCCQEIPRMKSILPKQECKINQMAFFIAAYIKKTLFVKKRSVLLLLQINCQYMLKCVFLAKSMQQK